MNKILQKNSGVRKAKRVLLKCDPASIADIHAIVESLDHLALVRTLEPDIAVVELICTVDTFAETLVLSKRMEKSVGVEILHPAK